MGYACSVPQTLNGTLSSGSARLYKLPATVVRYGTVYSARVRPALNRTSGVHALRAVVNTKFSTPVANAYAGMVTLRITMERVCSSARIATVCLGRDVDRDKNGQALTVYARLTTKE